MKIVDAWTLLHFTSYPFSQTGLRYTLNEAIIIFLVTDYGNEFHSSNPEMFGIWGDKPINGNLKYKSPSPITRYQGILMSETKTKGRKSCWQFRLIWVSLNISTDMRFSLSRIPGVFCVRFFDASGENFLNMALLIVSCGNQSILLKCFAAEIHKWKLYSIQRTSGLMQHSNAWCGRWMDRSIFEMFRNILPVKPR